MTRPRQAAFDQLHNRYPCELELELREGERFVLVERNRDGVHSLTPAGTIQGALDVAADQEPGAGWQPISVVDLDTADEAPVVATVEYVLAADGAAPLPTESDLRAAAQAVVDAWGDGDLAAAVRHLDDTLA